MSTRFRAYSSAAILVIACVTAGITIVLVAMTSATGSPPAEGRQSPTNEQLNTRNHCGLLLIELGLSPESLIAAGATQEQAVAVAQATRTYVENNGSDLLTTRNALRDQTHKLRACEERLRTGRKQAEDATLVVQLRADEAAARSSFENAKQSLWGAITGNLSDEVRSRIKVIRDNHNWRVPMQYRCVERTEAEWVQLRDAWLEMQSASESRQEPTNESLAILMQADANSEVVACKVRIEQTNMKDLQESWKNALADPNP